MKITAKSIIVALCLLTASAASAIDLGGLGNFINNTIANNNFSIDDLTGTWQYTSPAVSFRSENALQNIGGAAAATAVESQLDPYYKRLGFNRSSLEVDADHNFTLKLGLITLKGVVEKNSDDMLEFNFNAFGRVPLGKLTANATKSGDTLNLTFDATKFVNILSRIAGSLNNASLTALTTLLNSYDGIYIGFKMRSR
ncbi:MAG: DUF4923 family protein [Muribaculaceae bacterium]|nr:DUF4923 family protein [Muribaculaceae bacterium]